MWACLENLLLLLAEKEKAAAALPEVEAEAPRAEVVEKEAQDCPPGQKKPSTHFRLMPKKSTKRHTRMH